MNITTRILIVDDDPAIRLLLERLLNQVGYEVLVAEDGPVAVRIASQHRPDMILLDIMMPDMDGCQVATVLQTQPATSSIPILFMTSANDRIMDACNCGGVDYITKPFRIEEVLAKVAMHDRLRLTERALARRNAQLQTIMESLNEGLIVSDLDGTLLHWNRAALDLHGFENTEDVSRQLSEFTGIFELSTLDGIVIPYDHWPIPRLLRGERVNGCELRLRHLQDGWERVFNYRGNLIRDDGGQPMMAVLTVVDCTESRRAERELRASEERYRALFESSRDAIMTIAPPAWKFTSGNQAARRMFGANREDDFTSMGPWETSPEYQPDGRLSSEKSREMVEKAMEAGSHFFEWTHKRLNGEVFPATVLLARVDVGEQAFLQATVRDITEQKRAQEQLESMSRFPQESPDPVLRVDAGGTLAYANDASAPLLAFWKTKVGERIPEPWPGWIHEALNGRAHTRIETTHAGRTYAWILVPVHEAGYANLYGRDVTEQKSAEEALRQSETMLAEAQQLAHLGSWNWDTVHDTISWSDEHYRIFGLRPQEMLITYDRFLSLVHPDDRGQVQDVVNEALQGGKSFEHCFRAVRPDGTARMLRSQGRVALDEAGRPVRIFGSAQDITERAQAEEILTQTARKMSKINLLQEGLLGPGTLSEKLVGITDGAVRIIGADFCRIWVTNPGDMCDTGCTHAESEEGCHACEDRDRCLHLVASSGRYTHTDGRMHRRVPFGCYKIGLLAAGDDHKFLTNEAATDPRVHDHAWANELGLVSFAGYQLRTSEGKTLGVMAMFSRRVLTPEDDALLESLANTATQVIQSDRNEEQQKSLQAQLVQSQRLESVGQLASGIAHEINTPTQFVSDNTRFLQKAFPKLKKVLDAHAELVRAGRAGAVPTELLDEIETVTKKARVSYLLEQIPDAISDSLEGLERVTRIVRAMKDFSHPGQKEMAPADLNKAIESTVTVARNEWKYVSDMVMDLDPSLPPVPCALGDFNQVILNLVVNAAHAIADVVGDGGEGKGTITVSTRPDGDHVRISISDTGTGIPVENRCRVFEHFFTTKDVGKGTGQGLAIARSVIVEKHGGTITFETETGKGTTFIIRLPVEARSTGAAEIPDDQAAYSVC